MFSSTIFFVEINDGDLSLNNNDLWKSLDRNKCIFRKKNKAFNVEIWNK